MKLGFTLVELLVTISIMMLVMGVALVAFSGTRATTRDAKRQGDLEAIRSALELYRADNSGYPPGSAWQSALTSGQYLTDIPSDPLPDRSYDYTPAGCGASVCASYSLCAALEVSGTPVSGCGSCTVTCNYKTTQP